MCLSYFCNVCIKREHRYAMNCVKSDVEAVQFHMVGIALYPAISVSHPSLQLALV